VISLLPLVAALAIAVVQPQDTTLRVHDFAGLLSPAQRAELETIARDVERKTTAQISIVTVQSLDGLSVDEYANELFKAWGIGHQKVNNGVLFLIAPNERRVRIEAGYGIEPLLTDSVCGEIQDQHVVPRFKEGDYPAGILAGTRTLADIMLADPAAARGDPNSGPMLARTARRKTLTATIGVVAAAGVFLLFSFVVAARRLYSTTVFVTATLVLVALVGCAAFYLWRTPDGQKPIGFFGGAALASAVAWGANLVRYRRFGPHGCSKCGTHLELLSELDDDPKLTSVQRLEEEIGSVNYDVWVCPACLNQDTEQYIRTFSRFSQCPKCHARTYEEDPQRTVRAATTISQGLAQIDGRCVACKYKTSRQVVLPVIVPASTSSSSGGGSMGGGGWSGGGGGGGGSFGGGSSGGGGASRGW
jgi:uncharacterized protein